jgi:hypothetical protein
MLATNEELPRKVAQHDRQIAVLFDQVRKMLARTPTGSVQVCPHRCPVWDQMSSRAQDQIRQCKGYSDLSLYLDGNSVDRGGAVVPLPDGFESGFGKPWVTCPGRQIFNRAIAVNNSIQKNCALDPVRLRRCRIGWFRKRDQMGGSVRLYREASRIRSWTSNSGKW